MPAGLFFRASKKKHCFENVVRILKFGILGMGGHPFAYGGPDGGGGLGVYGRRACFFANTKQMLFSECR
jgi:hypothetical protein